MKIDRYQDLLRDLKVQICFLCAALGWYVFFQWVIPFVYIQLTRYSGNDFSYLWDGFAERMNALACPGAVIIAGSYFAFLLVRSLRRFLKRDRPVVRSNASWTWQRLLQYEVIVFVSVVVIGGMILSTSRQMYDQMKVRYFQEVVVARDVYKRLSADEKVRAEAQYTMMSSRAGIQGMFNAYGARAYNIYHVQLFSFWFLVFGWPIYLGGRFLFWIRRELDK